MIVVLTNERVAYLLSKLGFRNSGRSRGRVQWRLQSSRHGQRWLYYEKPGGAPNRERLELIVNDLTGADLKDVPSDWWGPMPLVSGLDY